MTSMGIYGIFGVMLKQIKNHTLYEVRCEYVSESVYVDHKPTRKEICQLRDEIWPDIALDEIKAYKETHFYTKA